MLLGKEKNSARAMLRKALKENRLMIRTVYYDYYDSCHSPVETPNAPFMLVSGEYESKCTKERLTGQNGCSISIMPNGMFRLWTGYSTYEVCTSDQLTNLHKLITK